MKALATALVLCTAIVCGCHYGLPFATRHRELALAERTQAAAERNVAVTMVLVAPPATSERQPGLRIAPSTEALHF